jgi:hypothetical protein
MILRDVLIKVDTLDRDDVIFARRPWTLASECVVRPLDSEFGVPLDLKEAGFEYFLDVPVALEVLEVFGDKPPTEDEKLRILLHYAQNDAYPEWVAHR